MEICSQSKHSAFKLGKLSGLWRILKTSAPNKSPGSKTCHQSGTTTVAVNIGGRFDAQHDTL
jgi:hypothetical protein